MIEEDAAIRDMEVDEDDMAEADDEDDADADDHWLLDEDSDAPNLIPEEHPRGILAGRIEMLDKIGEGGMGAVWRGNHLKLDRAVAVKVLDETLQLRADGRERFIREGKALALLDHPNVVRIYDCDQLADGKLFLCMELLEGDTLRALINSGVRPDPLEVIEIGLQICDAIEAAHKRGILHRDLTPSNIMRLRDPAKTIKVIDWGLCKYLDLFYMRERPKYGAPPGSRLVTPLGCRFGTPEYMAPEMILRENPGPPSFCTDVYALGVVLYELLTGRQPFAFGDRKQPRPIDTFLPGFAYPDLETALRRALCFDPDERTPNMAELREALDMARECLLAQRADAAPSQLTRATHTPPSAPQAALEVVPAAPIESMATSSETGLTGAAGSMCEAPLRPPSAPRPRTRGYLSVVVALLVGVGVGAGGMLLAQRVGGSGNSGSSLVLASMSGELPAASAAEAPAARCQAEVVSRPLVMLAPQEPPAATPPPASIAAAPPSSPTPGRTGEGHSGTRGETAVLAAVKGPARAPATSPRPATQPPPHTFQQAMARIEPKIRDCARKAGVAEAPTTVQVRRKGGELDTVRVLKLTKEHPFSTCVDQTVRKTTLPPGTSPIEAFTFFQ